MRIFSPPLNKDIKRKCPLPRPTRFDKPLDDNLTQTHNYSTYSQRASLFHVVEVQSVYVSLDMRSVSCCVSLLKLGARILDQIATLLMISHVQMLEPRRATWAMQILPFQQLPLPQLALTEL